MKVTAIMMVLFMVLFSVTAFAGEMEDPVMNAAKTVGKAAQGTVETAISPIEALGNGEPENVLVAPVKKGGETIYGAAEDTGKTLTGQEVE